VDRSDKFKRDPAASAKHVLTEKECFVTPPLGTIKHLVVLMMENRSFDHMFGFLKVRIILSMGLMGTNPIWILTG